MARSAGLAAQIDLFMKPENFGEVKTARFHHFGDSSDQGYATANSMEKVNIAFRASRLELAMATLGVDSMLTSEIHIKLKKSTFSTDRQSVLKYIRNDTKRFHTFVANSVSVNRDRKQSKANQYRHTIYKKVGGHPFKFLDSGYFSHTHC